MRERLQIVPCVDSVRRLEDCYHPTMFDAEENQIIAASAEEEVVYNDTEKSELVQKLARLFELARRKALDIVKKLSTAGKILHRI